MSVMYVYIIYIWTLSNTIRQSYKSTVKIQVLCISKKGRTMLERSWFEKTCFTQPSDVFFLSDLDYLPDLPVASLGRSSVLHQ